jgi:hypothetical protein
MFESARFTLSGFHTRMVRGLWCFARLKWLHSPWFTDGFMVLARGSTLAGDVHYNFMPGKDFSKYHTYKWITILENTHPNQIVSQEIKQARDRP